MLAAFDVWLEGWVADDEGRLRTRRLGAVLVVCYVVFSVTYLPINLFSVGRNEYTLFLPGEARLPFLPIFEYLYVLSYMIGFLLIVTVRDYATLRRMLIAFVIALSAAYITYLVFPVYLERPSFEVDSLHTWLLSIEYKDKPYNHFPSLHVTLSCLTVHASQVSPRSRVLLHIVVAGIAVSTVFVKQHYIVDALYGYVLAWAAWRLARPSATTAREAANQHQAAEAS